MKAKVQDCVYTRRKASDLQAEAERLIAAGEMPSLEALLTAVVAAREKYSDQIRASRRSGRTDGE